MDQFSTGIGRREGCTALFCDIKFPVHRATNDGGLPTKAPPAARSLSQLAEHPTLARGGTSKATVRISWSQQRINEPARRLTIYPLLLSQPTTWQPDTVHSRAWVQKVGYEAAKKRLELAAKQEEEP